jgi:adenosine deaminase
MVESVRPLVNLPKGHFHVHLDGAFPADAIGRLAKTQGKTIEIPAVFRDVWHFFNLFDEVAGLVSALDELSALCREFVKAEADEGVFYSMPAIEPRFYHPRLGGLREITVAMLRGFEQGSRDTGVEVQAALLCNTDVDAEFADGLADIAVEFAGRGISTFGTSCFKEPGSFSAVRESIKRARAEGLSIQVHVGQTSGPETVMEALDVIGPDRIAHGVRSAGAAHVLRRLADEGVVCDVVPYSNVQLGVVPSLEQHPAPTMIEAGVAVTLNADDPLMFDTTICDQYEIARGVWGFDDVQLAEIARLGIDGPGISRQGSHRLSAGIDSWLA